MDALFEEGSFMLAPATTTFNDEAELKLEESPSKPTRPPVPNVKVNLTDSESVGTSYAKDIRIQKFNPDSMDATTWTGNQVYELEMSGFKDQKKMIAKLLSGLPDELRYAVRTDMQQEFPKEGGIYGGTVKDFVRILKLHSMQTEADMMESLNQLKLGSNKDLRKFFYQIKGLVEATLDDKQKASGVADMIATAKFREKLPNYLRSNQLIASSTESGLKLVSLAQRIMNRCKSDGISANAYDTKGKSGKKWKNSDNRGNKWKKDKDGRRQEKSSEKCEFCDLQGHTMSTCYSFQKARTLRREELAKKRSEKSSK